MAATGDANLVLSHPAVLANYQLGAAPPPLQFVNVSSSGSALSYTASTSTSWLQLTNSVGTTPASSVTGFTPDSFGIRIDPSGLVPGTYVGTINVSVARATHAKQAVKLYVGSQPTLNALPSSLSFDASAGVSARTISISSSASATLGFTASIGNGATWLKVSPASGTTSGSSTITITANPSGLLDGTYNSSILLTVPSTNSTLTIPVRMAVNPDGSVQPLKFSLSSIDLTGVSGLADPQQQITVDSSARQEFSAVASSDSGWLFVDPFTGTAPGKITISVKGTAVPAVGDYSGSITVTSLDTGQATTIPVAYHYQDQAIVSTPASLSVTQSEWGVVPNPQTLTISSNASATFNVKTSAPWIQVTPTYSSAPAALSVTFDPKGLPLGTSSGTIEIAGPRNTIKVPVTLTLAQPPGPNVSPSSITFNYQLGGPTPTLPSISVSSTNQPVGFTAIATTLTGIRWLSINTNGGSTPATVTATINPDLLVPGVQTGTITITSLDGLVERAIPVSLTVTASGMSVQSILNAATFLPNPICAGELVTITGTGLGPTPGVLATPISSGGIDSTLSGIRVFFDGMPAPLLYVGNNQINAIVPYGVNGRPTVKVQVVQTQSTYSVPFEAKVADSAVGIFTVQGSGRGLAAAIHGDGSMNSGTNPVARGSVITLFGTGEGQTDAAGQDGRVIATDLRRPILPVRARIGGRPAEVLYIGSAPGMVSGVFQANVRVPDEVDPGLLSVEIQIGATSSQSGVQIAVK